MARYNASIRFDELRDDKFDRTLFIRYLRVILHKYTSQ